MLSDHLTKEYIPEDEVEESQPYNFRDKYRPAPDNRTSAQKRMDEITERRRNEHAGE